MTFERRLFVTNNFIPLANQFLRQFPTQHHPVQTQNIKVMSVSYGAKGYVRAFAAIESANGTFLFYTRTIGGTNHLESFYDLTDFSILNPTGTVSEAFLHGSPSSAITNAPQAKEFVTALLKKYDFDFQNYLSSPVAVPYSALPNYGLWQVRYLRKNAESNHEYIEFVIDGTGKTGSFLRLVEQSGTWSLPSTLEQ
jgi:hypothetical protein